jgi:SAM-dependent methyltransferase
MTSLSPRDRASIIERYSSRLAAHGVDLKTLNVGDPVKYAKQHAVHAGVGDLEGATVLDVGCGLATYLEFLRSRNVNVKYIGFDIVPPFIEINRERFPECTFEVRDFTAEGCEPLIADYVTMCQVFNNRYEADNNESVVGAALEKAFAACRRAVSVDMLSTYVNFREPNLAYFSPERMFGVAKAITKYVRLRHDYLPHHFTLFLYRDEAPP